MRNRKILFYIFVAVLFFIIDSNAYADGSVPNTTRNIIQKAQITSSATANLNSNQLNCLKNDIHNKNNQEIGDVAPWYVTADKPAEYYIDIDLGYYYNIDEIVLYHQYVTSATRCKLNNLTVICDTSPEFENAIVVGDTGLWNSVEPYSVRVESDIKVRYIRIYSSAEEGSLINNGISEIQVYSSDYSLLATKEDLINYITDINLGICYDAVLLDDIDLGGTELSPMGSRELPYENSFDGNGKTVSGYTIKRFSSDNIGFFGYVGQSGIVKNLTLNGTIELYENEDLTQRNIGGVAGCSYGTIENCLNHSTIYAISSGHAAWLSVGGIVGENAGITVNCGNYGNIYAGSKFCETGGITGFSKKEIVNSFNYGKIENTNGDAAGISAWNCKTSQLINTLEQSGNTYVFSCGETLNIFSGCNEKNLLDLNGYVKDNGSFFLSEWNWDNDNIVLRNDIQNLGRIGNIFRLKINEKYFENNMIAAWYDGNLLMDTYITKIDKEYIEIDLNKISKATNEVRIYIWKNLITLIPECEVYIIKNY